MCPTNLRRMAGASDRRAVELMIEHSSKLSEQEDCGEHANRLR